MLGTSQHTSRVTRQFKFQELQNYTNNFSEDRIIGRGAFGYVYKGVMDDGQEIAVKRLIDMPLDPDSEKKFHDECIILMMIQHQNIMRLLGYCDETHRPCVEHEGKLCFVDKNERALCFEYLRGGSLDKHVSNQPCTLDWDTCYKIIKGVCEGLNHLHNGYKDSIFHLDLKPANILLDNNMIPKIGDFGLSRFVSTTKTCTTMTPMGTRGYIPPEFIHNQEISLKYDVFSLGVVIIHIMAGRNHYYDHANNPAKINELVCEIWTKRLHGTMSSHASQEVMTCIEIALRCVNADRQERPTISNIVQDLNRIDTAKLSLTCEGTNLMRREALDYNDTSFLMGFDDNDTQFDSMEGIDHITKVSHEVTNNNILMHDPNDLRDSIMRDLPSTSISEPRDATEKRDVDMLDNHRRNTHQRVDANIHTPVTMDTIRKLLQWAKSTISSQWGGTEGQMLDEALCCLGSRLQDLVDTLPAMNDLIDRAEWKSHKPHVAEVLGNLKDAVYDADDLLDELRWYMLNVKLQGNGSQSLSMDIFNGFTQGIFIRSVDGIQLRLDKISTRLYNMGLREVSIRFDKSVRPETSSFTNEENFIGREKKLDEIIRFLCKRRSSSSSNPKRFKGNIAADVSTSNQVSSESSIKELIVYPIVGIGGVGKTTLAQHICSDARVKSHFAKIIWICVSDDFDVKRLTKEIIESCLGKQATSDNLDILHTTLSDVVSRKKYLIVLDDIWDDALKENGQRWKTFCAPLKNMMQGGVMMVTTRCQKVANRVATGDCITLEGLDDDVFWNLFKLCVFESGNSNKIDPELERIGRSIITKLKGSPLAAKTLGRILRVNHEANYWKGILESELWTLKQDENDILPALRLSYIYLPVHLKRCFSLCAVYEKDYQFERDYLVEIWVAEGFVYPQGNIPIQDIGREYFDELLYRSFFQKVQGKYVIHDLLHDMAQKVSEFECFIVKRKSDFTKIPDNVRHLSILSSTYIGYSDLLGLRSCTKLRTLLCSKPLADKKSSPRLIEAWCNELRQLRVIVLASMYELPANIDNLKHLRYLQIKRTCPLKSLPEEFCWLYYLRTVRFQKCKLESLPADFSKLICLQTFESHGFRCDSMFRRSESEQFYCKVSVDAANDEQGLGFRLIKNINQLSELVMYNISKPICEEDAAEAQLHNKKYLEKLNLRYSPLLRNAEDGDIELLRLVQPPTGLKSMLLDGYQGVSLGLESLSLPRITDLIIDGCENLSSLEHVIHLASTLKKFAITNCKKLVSVPAERFGDLCCLEELKVERCPNINAQSLIAPSLQRLVLGQQEEDWSGDPCCGNLAENVDCCSLTYFYLSCSYLPSIQLQKWNLPALEELHIKECGSLTSIIGQQSGKVIGGRAFKSLTSLTIERCRRLSTIDDLLTKEYLPAVERIRVTYCHQLVSLPGETFGHFSSLKELEIFFCGDGLSWRTGLSLPSSLQILSLGLCGDISAWVPSLLQNLASLVTLKLAKCQHITSIPGDLWTTSLTSLENLIVWGCQDIVSIGGVHAITEIKNIAIGRCPKLKEVRQRMIRGSYVGTIDMELLGFGGGGKSELLAESTFRHLVETGRGSTDGFWKVSRGRTDEPFLFSLGSSLTRMMLLESLRGRTDGLRIGRQGRPLHHSGACLSELLAELNKYSLRNILSISQLQFEILNTSRGNLIAYRALLAGRGAHKNAANFEEGASNRGFSKGKSPSHSPSSHRLSVSIYVSLGCTQNCMS